MVNFLITFLFIFGWKMAYYFDLIMLLSGALIFIGYLILGARIHYQIHFFALLLLLLCGYSLLVCVVNGVADLDFSLRSIRALINFVGASALVYMYWKKYGEVFPAKISLHILLALIFHGILIVAMYANEGLRLFVYTITDPYPIVNLNYPFLSGLRIPGLTYGLSQTSVLQMYGILLLPFVFSSLEKGITRQAVLLSALSVLPVSMLLTGRSGLFLVMFLFPAACLMTVIFKGKIQLKIRSGIGNISKIIIGGIILLAATSYLSGYAPEQFYKYNWRQAGEVIEVLTDFENTETQEAVSKMYFLPDSILETIFGSSNYGRGEAKRIDSDVGFVRGIFAIGIVGTILMLLPYGWGLINVFPMGKYAPALGAATLMILLSGIILHFKEIALFTRNQWSVQSLLICSGILMQYQRSRHGGNKEEEGMND